MTDMVQKISKALLELRYDLNFSKNNKETKRKQTDSVDISQEGRKMANRQQMIDEIKKKVEEGTYLTEEIIDSVAHKIARLLL